MGLRAICAFVFAGVLCVGAVPLSATPGGGKIAGVVVDSDGTPQMGASVLVTSELLQSAPIQLLTNDRGRFSTEALPSGVYSVHVTLAGFLPSIEQRIKVDQEHPALLEIVLGTVFSSLDKLRRQPDQAIADDDWTWVLRTSAATRPVLRWRDDDEQDETLSENEQTSEETSSNPTVHGRFELTSGADHPGSISNLADSPGTEFVYDLGTGAEGQFLVAGQFSHEDDSSAGGFAAEWLPSGQPGMGPVTTLLVRESRMAPGGPAFRGLRLSHDDAIAIGDLVSVRYGAEYLVADYGGSTSALRPRVEVAVRVANGWLASATLAAGPWENMGQGADETGAPLQSALNTLDAFPTLLERNGHPVFENGLHQELALDRVLSKRSDVRIAVFHDASSHTAVFGRGNPPGSDFLQDYFSQAFAYDGGSTSSTGARAAYLRKLADNLTSTLVYAYGSALAPESDVTGDLRDHLAARYRHSVAAGLTASVPRVGTKFTAGYKWLSGPAASQQDAYGEALYHLDPYFSMEVRQALPNIFSSHLELEANMGNLFAQGYVPVSTSEGNVTLVPASRYFRGGLSVQF